MESIKERSREAEKRKGKNVQEKRSYMTMELNKKLNIKMKRNKYTRKKTEKNIQLSDSCFFTFFNLRKY